MLCCWTLRLLHDDIFSSFYAVLPEEEDATMSHSDEKVLDLSRQRKLLQCRPLLIWCNCGLIVGLD